MFRKGICWCCKKELSLTLRGRIPEHPSPSCKRTCRGSGGKPTEENREQQAAD